MNELRNLFVRVRIVLRDDDDDDDDKVEFCQVPASHYYAGCVHIGKRKASVCCLSVCPSDCLSGHFSNVNERDTANERLDPSARGPTQ